eukprot:scaffold20268_cov111-Isochrysis_galbana.AAC.14
MTRATTARFPSPILNPFSPRGFGWSWIDAPPRFLTPRDVHTHFQHIIHRALTTRERGLTPQCQCGTLCRMCAGSEKKTPRTWRNATSSANYLCAYAHQHTIEALKDPFVYPLTPAARKHQAIRILFACPAEPPPQAIVNFMIILKKLVKP